MITHCKDCGTELKYPDTTESGREPIRCLPCGSKRFKSRRVDIKKILADPELREKLIQGGVDMACEMEGHEHKSYYGVVKAAKDSILIGGVKKHVTCRFELRQHAQDLIDTIVETNQSCNRKVESAEVLESKYAPQIYADEMS